jgi:hypothetical protein
MELNINKDIYFGFIVKRHKLFRFDSVFSMLYEAVELKN